MKIYRKKDRSYGLLQRFENINIKMDDYALKQVSKFKYLGSTITEDGEKIEKI
jgi:hypothetical protein